MLAAQEIFKAVEVTFTEYHDEISRSRQENELLKSRLLEAGIPVYPGESALFTSTLKPVLIGLLISLSFWLTSKWRHDHCVSALRGV